jgi:hypothetical protein
MIKEFLNRACLPAEVTKDRLNEFERMQLLLQLSSGPQQIHGD